MRIPAAAAVLLLASCSIIHERAGGGPVSGRQAEAGMLEYDVGHLSFLAPDRWDARGDERRVTVSHPEDAARLEVERVDRSFRDEKECLADAEAALSRGAARLTNVRRHASSFAGRKAVTQEADQGGWHGQAWAVCDGAEQYRVFFAGKSPWTADVKAAWGALTKSAAMSAGGGRS